MDTLRKRTEENSPLPRAELPVGRRESRVCNNNSVPIKPSKEVNIRNQEARHPTETPTVGRQQGRLIWGLEA